MAVVHVVSLRITVAAVVLVAGLLLIGFSLISGPNVIGKGDLGSSVRPRVRAGRGSGEDDMLRLRRENDRLKREISRLMNEVRDLRETLSRYRSVNESSQLAMDEMRSLRERISNLLNRLDELNRSYTELKSRYEALYSKYQELRREHDRLVSRYKDLLSRYENLTRSLDELRSYRSSAARVRGYVREAREFLKTDTYREEFYDWRLWLIGENYNPGMSGAEANRTVAWIFARMVERDLRYNADLYRRMLADWLMAHPANDTIPLANEVARLFYSLDHRYAVPGKDEPNAELPLFPVELLAYGLGDCEDHAMLMAALYRVAGIRTAIVVVRDHTDVAINLNGTWLFLEASLHGKNQEDLPSGFYSTVTIWTLQKEYRDRWGGYRAYLAEINPKEGNSRIIRTSGPAGD